MSIRASILDHEKLIVLYISAEAQLDEFLAHAVSAGDEPPFRKYNELIVVQNADAVSQTGSGGDVFEKMNDRFGPDSHYRSAFVVQSLLDFGLVRRFSAHRGRDPASIQVFMEIQPAFEFLGLDSTSSQAFCLEELSRFAQRFGEPLWF